MGSRPVPTVPCGSRTVGQTTTPDGSIGRITTSGVVSNYTNALIDGPSLITAGPDGALWFSNHNGIYTDGWFGSIGRITTSGVVSAYENDGGIENPLGITPGPDGALWYTNVDSIGRITPGSSPPVAETPVGAIGGLILASGLGGGFYVLMRRRGTRQWRLPEVAHNAGSVGRIPAALNMSASSRALTYR